MQYYRGLFKLKEDNYLLTINPRLSDLIYYLETICEMPRPKAIKICGKMFNCIPKKYRTGIED